MIVPFRNEKLVILALYRSPLTVTLWPSSFFEENSTTTHKVHQTVSFLDVTVFHLTLYRCGLASHSNAAVLFVDVAIQPEVRFII
ncbi:hypothetical protein TNCV_1190991 [Trichonephila clavipes]|nr:hypothetical protein TNCV_1190991 [Trichonephila clavipes]